MLPLSRPRYRTSRAALLTFFRTSATRWDTSPMGPLRRRITTTAIPLVGDLLVWRMAVLYEVERAARLQHTAQLGKGSIDVRDGTEGPGREHRVELAGRQIEM